MSIYNIMIENFPRRMNPVAKLGVFCVLIFGCSEQDQQRAPNAKAEHKASVTQDLASEVNTWVYIDNGAIQCEKAAMPLSQTRERLVKSQLRVSESQCAVISGTAVAALCGLKDTGIHMHKIPEQDLKRARSLGFEPISALSHYGNKSFKKIDCPKSK